MKNKGTAALPRAPRSSVRQCSAASGARAWSASAHQRRPPRRSPSTAARSRPRWREVSGRCSGSYWAAAQADTTEQLVLAFDRPQSITRLVYAVEEVEHERTQEIHIEVSTDGG